MKTLVAFYSFEGNTRFVADQMATALQADRLDLILHDDLKSRSFIKYLWGGKQVLLKQRPALEPFDIDPQAYDLILLGTPVWAGTYAPALATFFDRVTFSDRNVALFCCYGGTAGRTFARMVAKLAGNRIVGQIGFREPLKHDSAICETQAANWARDMARAAEVA